jgi:hypothetical protein
MEERWSPSHYQVNKLFDHGYVQLTVHADAVLETGRNIPEKLRNAIERRLEKIAESEMDLDYLGRQIVARFQYKSATSKSFHALVSTTTRRYNDRLRKKGPWVGPA